MKLKSNILSKKNVQDIIGMTPVQEGLLFHYLADKKNRQYYEQLTLHLEGNLIIEYFEKTWNHLVKENEVLRTVFRWESLTNPIQIVLKEAEANIYYFDLNKIVINSQYENLKHIISEKRITELLKETLSEQKKQIIDEIKKYDSNLTFDFTSTPLRIYLLHNNNQSIMILSYHHILFDGWSTSIILRDFIHYYNFFSNKKKPEIKEKKAFKEYLRYLQNIDNDYHKSFWKKYFDGYEFELNNMLLSDRKSEYGFYIHSIKEPLYSRIIQYTQSKKISLSLFIYLIWGIVESYYTNKSDLLIGVTTSGRNESIDSIENMVGLFVQTNPIRIKIDEALSFSEYIAQYQRLFIEWMSHTAYSLPQIKKDLNLQGKQELFNTLIVIENYPIDKILSEKSGSSLLSISNYEIQERSHHNLLATIHTDKELVFKLSYNLDNYPGNIIQNFMTDFQFVIETILSTPNIFTGGIFDCLSAKYKNLHQQMCSQITYPKEELIHQQIEKQAKQTPHQIAIESPVGCITYEQLNKLSNKLAHSLLKIGINNNTTVGIKINPSSELIIALLAVMKAGGVYIPIDPKLPAERINYMLQNSGANMLICEQNELLLQAPHIKVINIKDQSLYSHAEDQNIRARKRIEDIMYIIYTSGSTGLPKGVKSSYNNVNSIMYGIENVVKYQQNDKVLCLTTVSFDPFIMESLLPLAKGITIAIADYEAHLDPSLLCNFIEDKSITIMQATPSRIKLLLESEGSEKALLQIRLLMLGGEVLCPELYKLLQQKTNAKIFNLYGTTESTLFTTIQQVKEANDITIGIPIPNTYVYVMDRNKRVLPPDIQGEIYIGGDGISDGYKNKDELTKKSFIPDPYRQNITLYKTGDLGVLRSDMQYLYKGRIDNQVKIRGYRIELGEIESIFKQSPNVNDISVIVRELTPGNDQLIAYVSPDNKDLAPELHKLADSKLPEYMRPSHYLFMPALPINTNGKIDKKSLASLPFKQESSKITKINTSYIENILHDIWKEVLGMPSIPHNENFFDLGGHSLLAIQVVNKIKQRLNQEITVLDLFKYSTIQTLSSYLSGNTAVKSKEVIHYSNKKETNDVAVIGIACRFPKAINTNQYWDNLIQGKECISFFSDKELLEEGISIETIQSPNYVKAKGVLEGIEYFDANFFSYSPRESELMDPQIRVLHECTWHALEDAGCKISDQSNVGLYAGALTNVNWIKDLAQKQLSPAEIWQTENLNISVTTPISYKLNLKGPSVQVESACSTSLVAVHEAYNSLINDECEIALAGGVSITLPKKSGYEYQDGMIRSKDGHCRPFDISANGTLSGDGVGVVVLKKLDKAIKDKDQIYAVIKGTAINNDGKNKVGYSAPSSEGQAEVISRAYRNSNIDIQTISYIETHGTATNIGDPIEIEGLKAVYNTEQRNKCSIGSVKSNIGHLNAASGIAGFIKTVLCLKYKTLPKTLHYNVPNPKLEIENSPFYVQAETCKWESENNMPLRAGVSSFGIGGTNAHVALEEYIAETNNVAITDRSFYPIILSAKTEKALEQIIIQLRNYLLESPSCNLIDLCYTLQVGREPFEYKYLSFCTSKEDLVSKLSLYKKQSRDTYFSHTQSGIKTLELSFNEKIDGTLMLDYLSEVSPQIKSEYDKIYPLIRQDNQEQLAILYNLLFSENEKTNNSLNNIISLEDFSIKILALLWLDGVNINWKKLYNNLPVCKMSLPLYPFSKDFYWKSGYDNSILKQEEDIINNWVYLPSWKESSLSINRKEQNKQKWLLVNCSDENVISSAKQQFQACNILNAYYSESYQVIRKNQIGMNFYNSNHYISLIDFLQEQLIDRLNIIYYPQSSHTKKFNSNDYLPIEAFLYFIQNLGRSKSLKNVKILVVNEIKGIESLSHSLIKGSLVVANHEYSNLSIHWLDYHSQLNIDQMFQEFSFGFEENINPYHICYKQGKRYLRTYQRFFSIDPKLRNCPFKKGGTYLITGGLGGIALELLKDLADKVGNLNLLIISRRTFPPQNEWEDIVENNMADIATIEQIKKLLYGLEKGLSIQIESTDITNYLLMKDLYSKYIRKYGKIDGLIHAAGIPGGTLIHQETIENLKKTTNAKINGAYVIYQLLKDFSNKKPDFCIFFSSINTEIGSPGQFSYVAANQYLNDISDIIKSEIGISSLSIGWDTWSEVGMAVDSYSFQNEKKQTFVLNHYLFASKDVILNSHENQDIIYNFSLNSSDLWFINEHRFKEKALMPATGYIELIASAIKEHYSSIFFKIDEIVFLKPLIVEDKENRKTRLIIHKNDNNKLTIAIQSKPDKYSDKWIEHAKSSLDLSSEEYKNVKIPNTNYDYHIDYTKHNYNYDVGNLHFGERWKVIKNISYKENSFLAKLTLNKTFNNDLEYTILHPALFDIATSYGQSFIQYKKEHYIPFCYKNIRVYSKMTADILSYLTYKGTTDGGETISFDVKITDQDGKIILECEQFIIKKLNELKKEIEEPILIPEAPNYSLTIRTPGDINTLQIQACDRREPKDNEVEIEVMSTGLNFKEVLFALGKLTVSGNEFPNFGLECSGKVSRIGKDISHLEIGDEVIAIADGTFSQFTCVKTHAVVKKPKNLTFEEAATIPLAFFTAYYALVIKGNLQKTDKVLIHAASGGVGMAAIKIAQWIGAEIYATAGNEKKRNYLKSIGVKHVMNSRSLEFAEEIKLQTNSYGVDLILNSLSGESIEKSLSILAPNGRFLEIGLRDIIEGKQLSMNLFNNGRSFISIMIKDDLPNFFKIFNEISNLFELKQLSPIPIKTYHATDVKEAFTYMIATKHIGKIVINHTAKESNTNQKSLLKEGIRTNDGVYIFNSLLTTLLYPSMPQFSNVKISTENLNERIKNRVSLSYEHILSVKSDIVHKSSALHKRDDLKLDTPYNSPKTIEELKLTEMIEHHLGLDQVGINDSLAEIGMSSLDMIHITSSINDIFQINISVVDMYTYPTIEDLAAMIKKEVKTDNQITQEVDILKQESLLSLKTTLNRFNKKTVE